MGILGQVWYLIVSIPDLFRLSYFYLYLPLLTMHFVMYMFAASAEFKLWNHYFKAVVSFLFRLPLHMI